MDCGESETKTVLFINFDDRSDETGWALNCDGNVVWNAPKGSMASQEENSWHSEEACVSNSATCMFVISGGGSYVAARENSYFALRHGEVTIGFGELPQTSESYCFGKACSGHDDNGTTASPDSVVGEETDDSSSDIMPTSAPRLNSRFAPTMRPSTSPSTSTPSSKPTSTAASSYPTPEPTSLPTRSPTVALSPEPTNVPTSSSTTVSPTSSNPLTGPQSQPNELDVEATLSSQVEGEASADQRGRVPMIFFSRNSYIFLGVGTAVVILQVAVFLCMRVRRKLHEQQDSEEVTVQHANRHASLFDNDDTDYSDSFFENDNTSTYIYP